MDYPLIVRTSFDIEYRCTLYYICCIVVSLYYIYKKKKKITRGKIKKYTNDTFYNRNVYDRARFGKLIPRVCLN